MDDVHKVFKSLETKGLGKIIHQESDIFLHINEAKFRESYAELGLSLRQVEIALNAESKLKPKFSSLKRVLKEGGRFVQSLIN